MRNNIVNASLDRHAIPSLHWYKDTFVVVVDVGIVLDKILEKSTAFEVKIITRVADSTVVVLSRFQ